MKVIIHPNEAPIIYDDLGKRIEGIYNFDYLNATQGAITIPPLTIILRLYYWSDDDINYQSMLHQGWDKYNSKEYVTTPKVKPQGILHYVPNNFNAYLTKGDFEVLEKIKHDRSITRENSIHNVLR
ncbi:hypothetical protein [Companilactobacillus bobalius]|uniref:hypothetical protein n=1 Tax=Companilactobacillus bobalius TaxID=2801451 RepID=UPI0013025F85|nr:hypothetical protein [Companilactobacillus bobalius]KAE9560670.1 hypothetical protein ATN92_11070 [Companilactobacillus bobalius]